ncbi:MAG: arginine--tRNA ligase [Bacteroidales bacterium]|nr:arginine--tRNA ligase [Bacteroidales bacterium]
MKYALFLKEKAIEAIINLYNIKPELDKIQIQSTRKDFKGDFTLVTFPLLKYSKKSAEQTADEIGNYLVDKIIDIQGFNVIKGFLNLELNETYWVNNFYEALCEERFGITKVEKDSKTVLVEYSSPNTNKPLHLGHIRNNLIGFSISRILEANGKKVIKTNIVNDRGIHISKSMLAWEKWGNGQTPDLAGIKGDLLVGKYYVKFDREYKKEINELIEKGQTKEEAEKNAPLILEAREMLRKWEAGDEKVIDLWKKMNNWVYEGFDITYDKLGVDFDKIYYESDTYKLGKSIILDGLKKKKLILKDDGSVWANLTDKGLDEKLLLRSDGTSVYMTQDIGTAYIRYKDFKFDEHIYVVGNEQDYHFKVLKIVLLELSYKWAHSIHHLSYGMVELPEGKMKSREGTVVDADDLIDEMIDTAKTISAELGKFEGYSDEEINETINTIALGALKYFLLKVDPKKNMTFNPKESIDFNGNTGPFIQYTYARIQSLKRKAEENKIVISNDKIENLEISEKEIQLIKTLNAFPNIVKEAAEILNPALVANYIYELVKEFNQFYHDFVILKEENENLKLFRLQISILSGKVIKESMYLLGINVPERM